jgi:hypothetical protein
MQDTIFSYFMGFFINFHFKILYVTYTILFLKSDINIKILIYANYPYHFNHRLCAWFLCTR